MIDKYIESFSSHLQSAISDMFGVEYEIEKGSDGQTNVRRIQFLEAEDSYWVNISFHGVIAGDYFISFSPESWKPILEEFISDPSEFDEMLDSSIKECLNLACGSAINTIMDDFPDLTIASPKIIKGIIDYPETEILFSKIDHPDFSPIKAYLCLNLMEQDIGVRIEKVISQKAEAIAKAKKAENTIKYAVANLNQGLIVMNLEGKISLCSAAKIRSLFMTEDKDFDGKNIIDILPQEIVKNNRSEFISWLKIAYDMPQSMDWQDVRELCPIKKEITFTVDNTRKIYTFDFVKIEEDTEIMMLVEDVTKDREFMEMVTGEQEKNAMIAKVAIDKEGFVHFASEMEIILSHLKTHVKEKNLNNDLLSLIYKELHTAKGGALSYGLTQVGVKIHHFEEVIKRLQFGDDEIDISEAHLKIKSEYDELYQIFHLTLDELHNIISIDEIENYERKITLTEKKIDSLVQNILEIEQIKAQDNLREEIEKELTNLKKESFQKVLDNLKLKGNNLAEKLGKKVNIFTIGLNVEANLSKYQRLLQNLLHMVNNSIDHGVEAPEERILKGKEKTGTLVIAALKNETDKLEIIISDNGNGLDTEKIKTKAIQQKIITKKEASKYSEQEIFNLIFCHGFSTKEETSEVSGRGVGLASIKDQVDELDGKIRISSALGRYTSFSLELPIL